MANGPITTDTSSLAVGYAQIRVGASLTNIAAVTPVLSSSDSIGALTSTKYVEDREYYSHKSGFPALEDKVIPLAANAKLECAFEELSPKNLAMASGLDPASYSDAHSGEIALGALVAPVDIRMEAHYVFPETDYSLDIIFPRAQLAASVEADFQASEGMAVPITFESKRADSDVTGGNAAWDTMPLGRWMFHDTSS